MTTTRSTILTEAERLVSQDRAAVYGPPRESFDRIGALWGAMLGIPPVPGETVALMLVQLKVSRALSSPAHADSWVDIAGYAGLGGEMAAEASATAEPTMRSIPAYELVGVAPGARVGFEARNGWEYVTGVLVVAGFAGRSKKPSTVVIELEGSNTTWYVDVDAKVEVL